MNCQNIRSEIVQLLHAEDKSPQPAPEVSTHLTDCLDCQSFYRTEVELSRLLETQLGELEPPRQIWINIEETLWPGGRQSGWLSGFWWSDFRYAAAALVILLSIPLALIQMPLDLDAQNQILVELQDYELRVPENPFYDVETPENPFLDSMLDWDGSNPFFGVVNERTVN